tara:strand:+ start:1884 stop:2198 length:315 start_codon:yes stop_codon:yes gene_type:complete
MGTYFSYVCVSCKVKANVAAGLLCCDVQCVDEHGHFLGVETDVLVSVGDKEAQLVQYLENVLEDTDLDDLSEEVVCNLKDLVSRYPGYDVYNPVDLYNFIHPTV